MMSECGLLFFLIRGLKEENKKLQLQIKEMELEEEAEKQLQRRLQQSIEKVLAENADLSSSLAETRQKLESEIRVRENRDAKLLLDTQEVVVGREREKELKSQVSRLQNDLERERNKLKHIQEKVIFHVIIIYSKHFLLLSLHREYHHKHAYSGLVSKSIDYFTCRTCYSIC